MERINSNLPRIGKLIIAYLRSDLTSHIFYQRMPLRFLHRNAKAEI